MVMYIYIARTGVPGLPAASGGTPGWSGRRQPPEFPLDSQFSRWNDCKVGGSGAKTTTNFKFSGRNDCIFNLLSGQPLQNLYKNYRNTNGFCMSLNIRHRAN